MKIRRIRLIFLAVQLCFQLIVVLLYCFGNLYFGYELGDLFILFCIIILILLTSFVFFLKMKISTNTFVDILEILTGVSTISLAYLVFFNILS